MERMSAVQSETFLLSPYFIKSLAASPPRRLAFPPPCFYFALKYSMCVFDCVCVFGECEKTACLPV